MGHTVLGQFTFCLPAPAADGLDREASDRRSPGGSFTGWRLVPPAGLCPPGAYPGYSGQTGSNRFRASYWGSPPISSGIVSPTNPDGRLNGWGFDRMPLFGIHGQTIISIRRCSTAAPWPAEFPTLRMPLHREAAPAASLVRVRTSAGASPGKHSQPAPPLDAALRPGTAGHHSKLTGAVHASQPTHPPHFWIHLISPDCRACISGIHYRMLALHPVDGFEQTDSR